MIWLLGIAQIVSWGCLYYSFSLFVLPMHNTLGWSVTALNGALTCGLLCAGLAAYPVGAAIDRFGGRLIMSAGAALAALCLVGWSQVASLGGFYALWLALGVSMAATLYEPIFIVLNRHFGARAPRAITQLTLVAGFASTVFMPLIEWLLTLLPWRDTLVVLAVVLACISLPINALSIPRAPAAAATSPGPEGRLQRLGQRLADPLFRALTLWFTAWAATASGVMFQIVPFLKAEGVPLTVVLTTVALVGPMQVAGRAVVMVLERHVDLAALGGWISGVMLTAVLVLLLAPPTLGWLCLFAVMFGSANGITTILRGAVPGQWLGREGIGQAMGLMGMPMMIAAALAPTLTAAIWSVSGNPRTMLWALLALAAAATVAYHLAHHHYRAARRAV